MTPLSLYELNNLVRQTLQATMARPYWIVAELSEVRPSPRGHCYVAFVPMDQLVAKAQTVTSIGVQAGEGWLLTGEIVELIESGCPNTICAQPFACLPNHVTGRGMFGKIRRLYPQANIVSIDYDPGASEANQLNRIKLMIAAAKKNAAAGRSSV